jgi:hypothetical protein
MGQGARYRLWISVAIVAVLSASGSPDADAGGTIYFVDLFRPVFKTGSIRRIRSDGSGLETILADNDGVRALEVDEFTGHVYWSDVKARTFSRLRLANGAVETLIDESHSENKFWPRSLVIHRKSGKMFWGIKNRDWAHGLDRILSANLDGTETRTIMLTHYHTGLAIDHRDRIYWIGCETTDYVSPQRPGRIHWSIRRANLDGSGAEIIVQKHGRLSDIALDPVRDKLYFVAQQRDTIYVATLDGESIEPFYQHEPKDDARDLAVDPSTGDLYWNEQIDHHHHQRIMKRDSALGEVSVVGPAGGFGHVSSLVFVPDDLGKLASTNLHPPDEDSPEIEDAGDKLRSPPALAPAYPEQQVGSTVELTVTVERSLSIEFDSIPGSHYQIQYSSDLRDWQDAGVPVLATSTQVSWTDTGSPLTESHPSMARRRFYRVVKTK